MPIIIKLIDAADNLSVQVHPNDEKAKERSERQKTEMWYVVVAEKGAKITFNVSENIDKSSLIKDIWPKIESGEA